MNQSIGFILPTAHSSVTLASAAHDRLRAGETPIRAGDEFRGIVTVRSGFLKRYRVYKGQTYLAGLLGPGQSTGIDEALLGINYRETLEAIGETQISIEPKEAVDAWLRLAPPSVLQGLRASASLLRPEAHLRKPLDLLPVRARVAATLWMLVETHGRHDGGVKVLDLNLTREEVAHLAGTVYESVIRTLTSLKKEGVIDLNGRVIRILNEDQLARIGQISIGDTHVQNTVSKDHSPSDNRAPQEAS